MDEPVDLLIVGAGVVGLAAAWRAAGRGLRVRVVERDRAGAGASTAAAGLIAPIHADEWRGERGAANLAAMAAWPAFAAAVEEAAGTRVGFRRDGSLRLAFDEAADAALDDTAAALGGAGIAHERLDAAGVLAAEPGVRGARSGLLVRSEAHVATDRLVGALARACAAAGARVSEGVEPVAVVPGADGAVTGLRLSDGTVQPAGLTVIATGAWSATAAWIPPEARPDVRPLAGEWLLLRGGPVCRHALRTPYGSVTPRDDGRAWVGTSVRDAGFPTAPQAGALGAILATWTRILPALAELEVERVGVGVRPATPDGWPIVGPTPVRGLAVATGHGREGIIQAPLAADAVAGLADGTLSANRNLPKPDRI